MTRIRAVHFATGQKIDVVVHDGSIHSIESSNGGTPDFEAGYVAPAFFDLQINGCHGIDFSSESITVDKIRHVVQVCRQHGIGGLLPTLITNSFAALHHGMSTLRQAVEGDADLARAIPGIHLEGPYISPEDGPRGAHPRAHVRLPDWDEFQRLQDAADGKIRLVTLAPEHEGALAFIERLVQSKVVVALGHTDADGPRIRDAIKAGARLSTHLGNACRSFVPREGSPVFEQLVAEELWASLICDGHHLPPAVVRCFVQLKTPARLILTCDASSLAGLSPGRYGEWGHEMEILPAGKIVVSKLGVLAGSWAFTDLCVGNVIKFAGVTLQEAIDMATEQPRRLLGLPSQRLEPGMPADVVLFDLDSSGTLQVRQTMVGGTMCSSQGH